MQNTKSNTKDLWDGPSGKHVDLWSSARAAIQNVAKAQLAMFSHQVCRLCLTPVYGSIPSSAASDYPSLLFLVCLALVVKYKYLPDYAGILPVLGYSAPVIQSILSKYSGKLGPFWGPYITYGITTFPVMTLSLLSVMTLFVERELFRVQFGGFTRQRWTKTCIETIMGLVFISLVRQLILTLEWTAILCLSQLKPATSVMFNWFGIQALITALWVAFTRSRVTFLLGVLCLAHLVFLVPHLPLARNNASVNTILQDSGYSLVARQESLTGYISVLDSFKDGFRVMRCDHSLLGGEWTNKPEGHPAKLNEPIYSIFVTLEAVRLVESMFSGAELETRDSDKQALVIGLGVGTAPSALIAHGVSTTIIEIDPVVHHFALQYFGLPSNHTPIIDDAVKVVDEMQRSTARGKYDYIIHDVFTGGAEPIELFTREFLAGLRNLLSFEGVIAINYGGDLLLPSAISVIKTVLDVFANCRFFREVPIPASTAKEDFTNLVMFCGRDFNEITFREPSPADILGSPARRQHLVPQNEATNLYQLAGDKGRIIRRGQTEWLEDFQIQSARGHWHVMRKVLPDIVWDTW